MSVNYSCKTEAVRGEAVGCIAWLGLSVNLSKGMALSKSDEGNEQEYERRDTNKNIATCPKPEGFGSDRLVVVAMPSKHQKDCR